MHAFDPTQTPRFALLLAQREAELCAILRAGNGVNGRIGETQAAEVSDFKDAASRESMAIVDDVQADHAAMELEQVLAARRRIQEHSYGKCLECGDAIALGRLSAMPATPYCAVCQSGHERAGAAPTRH